MGHRVRRAYARHQERGVGDAWDRRRQCFTGNAILSKFASSTHTSYETRSAHTSAVRTASPRPATSAALQGRLVRQDLGAETEPPFSATTVGQFNVLPTPPSGRMSARTSDRRRGPEVEVRREWGLNRQRRRRTRRIRRHAVPREVLLAQTSPAMGRKGRLPSHARMKPYSAITRTSSRAILGFSRFS